MSDWSYDLTTSVGQLRLEIGDEVYESGVKPSGDNFTDTELEYFLAQEGSSVGRAAARACEVLSRAYAGLVDLTVGPRRESLSQASAAFQKRAGELRKQYGGGATSGAYSAGWIRSADGEPSDEYPTSSGSSNEYSSGATDDWWRGT